MPDSKPRAEANEPAQRARHAIPSSAAEFLVAEDDISKTAVWTLDPTANFVVVHLAGRMSRFESIVEDGSVAIGPPAPGEAWIVPAGCRYSAEARGTLVRYAEFRLSPDFLDTLSGEVIELRPRLALRDEFIYRAALRLADLETGANDVNLALAEEVTFALGRYVVANHRVDGPTRSAAAQGPGLDQNGQRRVQEFIGDNISRSIRLDDLCGLLGMTKHRLLEAFRAAFGISPAQYIINRRLGLARHLLASTPRDITDIALATGFSSHSHLSSTFRRATGVTPSAFREGCRR
ncbi:helix-turn-helix transcriptional regulator [Mesorhizobium sp. L-8-10]|uniref:helix-turn-helix transcriptional regulator n=1 Tax=Mesorhizobium sp. L-8-10 TaxID=2744523 RepID=UPI001926020D|nr:AraC family transcriptional regulator [Mesorhizobium sp. L-8-10]